MGDLRIRPYIDTENLDNDRLRSEEYQKALDYVREVLREYDPLSSNSLDQVDDSILVDVFKAGKEIYNFLDTLPEGDIAAILRQVFMNDLEKELEEEP